MPRIFVSYRRKSWPFTQRLADELAERVDAEIFVDFTGIDQTDFEHSILNHLRASDAVLLVVSEQTFTDRIHRDDDWVRREIREALTLEKPLIMVCVEGLLPPAGLPDDIKDVARMQGINFYPEYFTPGVERLAEFIVKVGAAQPQVVSPAISPPPAGDEKRIEGRETLDEALNLLQAGDFHKAIFLLEKLIESAYHSKYVNLTDLLDRARQEASRAERQRQAALDYDELVLLARRAVTWAQAQTGFKQWRQDYPDLADSLDTENLHEQFGDSTPSAPAPEPPPVVEPVTIVPTVDPDDPSLEAYAARLELLELALASKAWRRADDITIDLLRVSSGYKLFDSDESVQAIPETLLRRLHDMWAEHGKPLRQQGWFMNGNVFMDITRFVALLSMKTYLERRMDELGL